jgi:hypothetical protein
MCSPEPACRLIDFDQLAHDLLTRVSDSIIDSWTDSLTTLGTVWVKVKTPDLTSGPVPTLTGPAANADRIETLLGYATWIGLALAILSLIALGALIAVRMRAGEGVAAVGKIGLVLAAVIVLSSAASIVTAILPDGPRGVGGATGFVQSSLWWYMAAAAVASVIIGAARMVWEQRAHPGLDTVRSLLTLIVVAAAGVTITNMLITAADSFSQWVIDKAMGCTAGDRACFVDSVEHILKIADRAGGGSGTGPMLMIIIGLLALLSDLVQILLMVARSGMLVLLAGVLPIAASTTNTEMGKAWFKRCVAWLVAFLLYKPVASIIYAAAFKLVTNNLTSNDDLLNSLTGIMLMLLAVLALPALLRFVAPMTTATAGGTASGAGAIAAAARLPSGARATTASNVSGRSWAASAAPSGSRTADGSAGRSRGADESTNRGTADGSRSADAPGVGGSGSPVMADGSSAGLTSRGSTTTSRPDGGGSVGNGTPGSDQSAATGGSASPIPLQSRGRRYRGDGNAAAHLLQGAAMAAGAAKALADDATGAQQ